MAEYTTYYKIISTYKESFWLNIVIIKSFCCFFVVSMIQSVSELYIRVASDPLRYRIKFYRKHVNTKSTGLLRP